MCSGDEYRASAALSLAIIESLAITIIIEAQCGSIQRNKNGRTQRVGVLL